MLKNTWWPEKYRPKTVSEYVGEPSFVERMEKWINSGEVSHLLLHSETGGTGKTTAARIIANSLDADILEINASEQNGIEIIRDTIIPFASQMGFGKWKICILDESDFLTPNFQAALRPVMETYSSVTRFILTANHVDKIIQPIRSRSNVIEINSPPKKDVLKRLTYILESENVTFTVEDVAKVVKDMYPDQRSMINYLQENSVDGVFKPTSENIMVSNHAFDIVNVLKDTKKKPKDMFVAVRTIVSEQHIKHFQPIYRYLFDKIDDYAPNGTVGQVIISLAEAQYKDALVIDKEINFMAAIVNILNIIKGN
jgi:DNA polymerase III delta prime subunit